MALSVTRVDVWAGEIQDQPGGLANALSAIADAGGNVQCVIARREQSRPGTGVVFVTPVNGAKVQEAARGVGLAPATNLATVRVEGPDSSGLGARLMEAMREAGVNLRGVSAAVVGRKFVAYIGLDNAADANSAIAALRQVKAGGGGGRRGSASRKSSGAGKRARSAKSAKRASAKRAAGGRQ